MHLADHRADAAHLPHQPFHRLPVRRRLLGPELAGLLGEIHQDRARLEQRSAVVAVDDGGDAVVGADLEEIGLELLVLGDVDRVRGVIQAALLQHDGDLAAVGRRPRVKIDHRGVLGARNGLGGGRRRRLDERAPVGQRKARAPPELFHRRPDARSSSPSFAPLSRKLCGWCRGRAGRVLPYRRAALRSFGKQPPCHELPKGAADLTGRPCPPPIARMAGDRPLASSAAF